MKRISSLLFRAAQITGVDLTCSGTISLSDNKWPCGEDVIGYPYGIFITKPGQSITAAGAVPTPAEITTAMGLSTDAKVVCIMPIYNGTFAEPVLAEVQGPDDLKEVVSEKNMVTFEISNLADEVIDALRQMNIRQRAQIWIVDNYGRFYFAKTGVRASIYFPFLNKEFGNQSKGKIKCSFEWFRNNTVAHVTAVNTAYLDLNNA